MILIIDDDIAVRTSLSLLLKQAGYTYMTADGPDQALTVISSTVPELIIMDMNFSLETNGEEGLNLLLVLNGQLTKVPVILITGWGSITLAVRGMKAGAFDFINKPWNNNFLLQSIKTALLLSENNQSGNELKRVKIDELLRGIEKIIGEDPALLSILQTVERVAATEASILITGESGTGKELIAEAIHQNSKRINQPFVKVNLGGIPANLFESELFGHKKGAFTDAQNDRKGRFEMAEGGSIFLDEIGDLDISSQVKLLRVLQDRTYEVLGDSKTRTINTRIICATNRNLEEMVEAGQFREDLFYRINLIKLKLPSLRERSQDIPLLADHFIDNLKVLYDRPHLKVDSKAIKWLRELPFPGNIRELKNLIERTVLLSSQDTLEVTDFDSQTKSKLKGTGKSLLPLVGEMTLDEIEGQMIEKTMSFHKQNISKVARALGISRGSLYRRLEKYGISHKDQG